MQHRVDKDVAFAGDGTFEESNEFSSETILVNLQNDDAFKFSTRRNMKIFYPRDCWQRSVYFYDERLDKYSYNNGSPSKS